MLSPYYRDLVWLGFICVHITIFGNGHFGQISKATTYCKYNRDRIDVTPFRTTFMLSTCHFISLSFGKWQYGRILVCETWSFVHGYNEWKATNNTRAVTKSKMCLFKPSLWVGPCDLLVWNNILTVNVTPGVGVGGRMPNVWWGCTSWKVFIDLYLG
jgi:hypothetical protein